MKSSKASLCLSCFVLFAVSLLPVSPAQAQNNCTFDPNALQGPAVPPPGQAVPPYFVWKSGGRGDQSTVVDPATGTVQHSGLVSWDGTVDDTTFAAQYGQALTNGGAAYNAVPLVYVFGGCFGGGMIDEINALPVNNPISIVSASFFNQQSWYPALGINSVDFVFAYANALMRLNNPTAQSMAARASTDDPYGWSPATQRNNGEVRGSETPEYYDWNTGGTTAMIRNANEVNAVILWAGHPKQVDDYQLALMFNNLLARGYDANNIIVLYASGTPANSPALVPAMQQAYQNNGNQNGASHLRPATLAALTDVLQTWAFPAGKQNPPRFVFFLAADHGCNNAFQVMDYLKLGGTGGDDIYDGGSWGTGDPDYPIYPPRQ
jgi:hypothetical protein